MFDIVDDGKMRGSIVKITQSQLKQIIKEELQSALGEDCGPAHEEEQEPIDLAQMSPSEAFGLAWGNAIDALRGAGMEEAADLLQAEAGGSQASFGEPYEAQADLEEAKKKKKWMQDIKSTGECTPYTKPGCTGRSKAFAKRAQHGDVRDDNLKKGKNPHGPG